MFVSASSEPSAESEYEHEIRFGFQHVIEKPSSDDREYSFVELSNGLKVMLIQDDSEENVFHFDLQVQAGSTDAPVELQGLPHLVEHAILRQSFASSMLGVTEEQYTHFYSNGATSGLGEALRAVAVNVFEPAFLSEHVLEGLEEVDAEFYEKCWKFQNAMTQLTFSVVFDPFFHGRHFKFGNKKSLGSVRPVDLKNWHSTHYSPHRSTLAVTSSLSLSGMESLVYAAFEGIKIPTDFELKKFEEFTTVVSRAISNAILYNSYPLPSAEIRFEFYFPYDPEVLSAKPLQYISEIISHEGPGSLNSAVRALREETEAPRSPSSSPNRSRKVFQPQLVKQVTCWDTRKMAGAMLLQISFRLTERGTAIERNSPGSVVALIAERLFTYIELFKRDDVWSLAVEPLQESRKRSFAASRMSSSSLVVAVAGGLRDYPPERALSGPSVIAGVSEDIIKKYWMKMIPENLSIRVIGNEFASFCEKNEIWTGVPYAMRPLPKSVSTAIRSASKLSWSKLLTAALGFSQGILRSRFDFLPQEWMTPANRVTPHMWAGISPLRLTGFPKALEVFFDPDLTRRSFNAKFEFSLFPVWLVESKHSNGSPERSEKFGNAKNFAIATVVQRCIEESLAHKLHAGVIRGQKHSFTVLEDRFILSLEGEPAGIDLMLAVYTSLFRSNAIPVNCEETLERSKKAAVARLGRLSQYDHAQSLLNTMIKTPFVSDIGLNTAVSSLDFSKDFRPINDHFFSVALRDVSMRVGIAGNSDEATARGWVDSVLKSFRSLSLAEESKIPDIKYLNLTSRGVNDLLVSVTSKVPASPVSTLIFSVQLWDNTVPASCVSFRAVGLIFGRVVQRLFNFFRDESLPETTMHSASLDSIGNCKALLHLTIESREEAAEVRELIGDFLETLPERFANVNETQLATEVEKASRALDKSMKDLSERRTVFFDEVQKQNPQFDVQAKLSLAVAAVEKPDLIKLAKHVAEAAPKLAVIVHRPSDASIDDTPYDDHSVVMWKQKHGNRYRSAFLDTKRKGY